VDVPILYVTSEEDRFSQVEDAQSLFAGTADQRSLLVVVPGSAHAQALLYPAEVDPSAPMGGDVFNRAVEFLDLYLTS